MSGSPTMPVPLAIDDVPSPPVTIHVDITETVTCVRDCVAALPETGSDAGAMILASVIGGGLILGAVLLRLRSRNTRRVSSAEPSEAAL